MNYPNKTFVLDRDKQSDLNGIRRRHIMIIVADSKETAAMYINDKLNGDIHPNELQWLMGCDHQTIYDQTGKKALEVQAKIMYSTIIIS
jgi:hypothetical protein